MVLFCVCVCVFWVSLFVVCLFCLPLFQGFFVFKNIHILGVLERGEQCLLVFLICFLLSVCVVLVTLRLSLYWLEETSAAFFFCFSQRNYCLRKKNEKK